MLALLQKAPMRHRYRRATGFITATALLAAVVTSQVVRLCFVAPQVRAGSHSAASRNPAHNVRGSAVTRHAGERKAFIAVVDVDVTQGSQDAFIEASLANARASTKEDTNMRFDVLQSLESPKRFVLVEIYRNGKGPAEHKNTAHYLTWRETVADMMASPRQAAQYETIFPETAVGFPGYGVIKESDSPTYVDITHKYVDIIPGAEQAFIEETTKMGKAASQESGCIRYDVLQNLDDPTKFLLIEIFRSDQEIVFHTRSEQCKLWKKNVKGMLAADPVEKKYVNLFPTTVAGWLTAPKI